MKSYLLLFVLLNAIIFTSCEFEPSEIYYTERNIPSAPVLDINLNFYDSDTLFYYWSTEIKLNFSVENKVDLYEVNFYLDTTKLTSSNTNLTYSTSILINDLQIHTFRIELITSTGSNSLADEIGAEVFHYSSKEWILIPKINMRDNLSFTYTEDGLQLQWTEYEGLNFKNYLLEKRVTESEIPVNQNMYLDIDYLGEEGSYTLYIVDMAGNMHLWGKCYTENKPITPRIDTVNNMMCLVWDISPFKKNILEYELYSRVNGQPYSLSATVDPELCYWPVSEFLFGQTVEFTIKTIPKNEITFIDEDIVSYSFEIPIGISGSPIFDQYDYITPQGFFYRYNDEILYYSYEKDESHSLCPYRQYKASPNGEYLFFPDGSNIELYSLEPFSLINQTAILDLMPEWHVMNPMAISDNGILLTAREEKCYVIDMFNSQRIASFMYPGFVGLTISTNGEHMIIYSSNHADFYEIVTDTVNHINSITDSTFHFSAPTLFVIPDEPSLVFNVLGSTLRIRSIVDLAVQSEINLNGSMFFAIDYMSDRVLTYDDENFFVYDLHSGYLEHTIPSRYSYRSQTLLLNNVIYNYRGLKYIIN